MDRRSFVGMLTAGAAGQAFSGTGSSAQTATAKKFVVVGGGMAGAACAKYLSMWGANSGLAVEVTLVTPETQYLSCILSNGVLVGDRTMNDQSFGYSQLTSNHNVQLVTASVEGINSDSKTVTCLSSGFLGQMAA